MIVIDPSLDDEIAELLVALQGYLDARGVARDSYAAGPVGGTGDAPYRFCYPLPSSFKTWPAEISFPAADGTHVLTSDFSSARTLFAALLTLDDQRRWEGIATDAKAETVLTAFGLAPSDYLRSTAPTAVDRLFLARDAEGFAFGYSDIRPPEIIFSRSAKPAPVAIHLALERRAEEAGLYAALAEHLPPFP
jgi:hypothetical protein